MNVARVKVTLFRGHISFDWSSVKVVGLFWTSVANSQPVRFWRVLLFWVVGPVYLTSAYTWWKSLLTVTSPTMTQIVRPFWDLWLRHGVHGLNSWRAYLLAWVTPGIYKFASQNNVVALSQHGRLPTLGCLEQFPVNAQGYFSSGVWRPQASSFEYHETPQSSLSSGR